MHHYIVRRDFGFAFYRNGKQYGAATHPLTVDFFGLNDKQLRTMRKYGVAALD